jgi:hypothetical protein
MATTSNYGWTTPDDSSLVKDGASAIRALGTAIDTSMNTALGTKKAGLVLLSTDAITAVSSYAKSSFFTSTYDNYLIDVSLTSVTTGDITLKLRNATTDNSTNHDYGLYGFGSSATTRSASGSNTSANLMCRANTGTAANRIGWQTVIQKPNLAQPTTFLTVASGCDGTGWFAWSGGGVHFVNTAYDGFNIIFGGTTTGTMNVYGYNK